MKWARWREKRGRVTSSSLLLDFGISMAEKEGT